VRSVVLNAQIPDTDPETALRELARFDRYPDLTRHVKAADVHQTLPNETGSSSWELHFRSGILRWDETEQFKIAEGRIEFAQDDGDFDSFSGAWQVRSEGSGALLEFRVDFDFGIPSMESILDPIAERVLLETAARAVVGIFEGARLLDVPDSASIADGAASAAVR
jgi:ribosome-associated toxin RatA of RatAB toxin-antitoxin module